MDSCQSPQTGGERASPGALTPEQVAAARKASLKASRMKQDGSARTHPQEESLPAPVRFMRAYYGPDAAALPLPPQPQTVPLHVFPEQVQTLLSDLAASIDGHVNIAAGMLLGLVASMAGGKIAIALDDNDFTAANAYVAVLGEKSDGKSAMQRKLFKTAKELNFRLLQNYAREKEQYEAACRSREKEKDRGAKNGDGLPPAPPRPKKGAFLLQDFTRAAMTKRFAQASSQAIVVDELAGLFKSIDAYEKSPGATKETFLTAYEGGSLESERADEGRCQIARRAWLTIVGGLQTVRLRRMFSEEDMESGLLSRFIFCRGGTLDHIHQWSTASISKDDWEAIRTLTERLHGLPQRPDGEPAVLRVPDEIVRDVWIPWYNQRERDCAVEAPHLRFLIAKHSVHTQKCILWLHLMRSVFSGESEITRDAVQKGIELGDWLSAEGLLAWKMLEAKASPRQNAAAPLDSKAGKALLAEQAAILRQADASGFVPNDVIMGVMRKHGVSPLTPQGLGRILARLQVPEPAVRKASMRGRLFSEEVFRSLRTLLVRA